MGKGSKLQVVALKIVDLFLGANGLLHTISIKNSSGLFIGETYKKCIIFTAGCCSEKAQFWLVKYYDKKEAICHGLPDI